MSDPEPGIIYTHGPIPYRVIVGVLLASVVALFICSFNITEPGQYDTITEYCEDKDIKIKFGPGGFGTGGVLLRYSPPVYIKRASVFLEKLESECPDVVWYDDNSGAFWFYNHTSQITYYLWGVR